MKENNESKALAKKKRKKPKKVIKKELPLELESELGGLGHSDYSEDYFR